MKKLFDFVRGLVPLTLTVGGAAAITYGMTLISYAAGFITGGAFAILAAIVIVKGMSDD